MTRRDGRAADEIRPLVFHRRFVGAAPGSVLISAGRTTVLCSASIEDAVPAWLAGQGRGWITAEYNMLPGSTRPRKPRERTGKLDGRTAEIQRLVGRSLRAVADLAALGERTLTIDCDVLEADGGTRTASVNGALVAAIDALRSIPAVAARNPFPLRESVAAISVGLIDGRPVLDLDYAEDVAAAVDMNVVMTGVGRFVEVQGTGEGATFDADELQAMLTLAGHGIEQISRLQRDVLAEDWPW